MMLRRICAGSIVALLLSVSSLAAACDLSCAFPSMSADCHSEQTEPQGSLSGGMKMDGMAMAGMTMPEMGSGANQPAVSAISRTNASHPSIGEMGPCERQSCDSDTPVSARMTRSIDSRFHSILANTETPRANCAPTLFHDARDGIAHYRPNDATPLHLSLRI
jgi:hypothetical protein